VTGGQLQASRRRQDGTPSEEWRETGSTTCLQPSIPGDSGSGFSPYRQVGHLVSITGSCGPVASVVVPTRAVERATAQAAVLESVVPNHMDTGPFVQASRINSLLPWTIRSPRLTRDSLG